MRQAMWRVELVSQGLKSPRVTGSMAHNAASPTRECALPSGLHAPWAVARRGDLA